MMDEALLDAPDDLLRADPRGLLRSVAAAGAHVRTAALAAAESDLAGLHPEGRPGTLLVAGRGPEVPLLADLLAALTGDTLPVARLRPTGPVAAPGALRWTLPRWVGPVDLLLVLSTEGSEPGLAMLVNTAYRRGCSVASVTPAGTPLAETTAHRRGLTLPLATAPYVEPAGTPAAPGPHWAVLTPALLLGDRLGLFTADPAVVHGMAERLDTVAERCGPAMLLPDNPAKALATELDAALPLLWSEGPLARAVARHAAAILTGLAGRPALAAELPEALTAHAALLGGVLAPGGAPEDFFRDRVEEPQPMRARIVLLHSELPRTPETGNASATVAARELAFERGLPFSELEPPEHSGDLDTAAELIAQLDFAAVYLCLARSAGPAGPEV